MLYLHRYQQMLHRNLMYLAGLVDPNLQNMLPVRSMITFTFIYHIILKY